MFPGVKEIYGLAITPLYPWLIDTSDLKYEILVVSFSDARCDKVSAWTGWPSISILWLNEINLTSNFYLSVPAFEIV